MELFFQWLYSLAHSMEQAESLVWAVVCIINTAKEKFEAPQCRSCSLFSCTSVDP